ncbi:HAD family hydrolase [Propioniciclava soli]|uniref:HAD family hydrolase n=1 Tax=Propioniciclava soli TaxID=2775081 RepID=A0ABZ3C8Q1_9ACTN|nr:HAD family hydrolase [Propioniciclava soli]
MAHPRVRLIASDIDGTLLRSDHTVSDRTRAAVAAAQDAGVPVVLISGRQAPVLAPIAAQAGLSGPAICANGAVGYHLGRQEVLFEELLAVAAQTELLHAVRAVYPGVRCVSVREAGFVFVPERGYTGMMDPGDHGRPLDQPDAENDLAAVLGTPSTKFILRQPGLPPEDLLALALDLAIPGTQPTISGASFLEVAAAGVTKSSGLARLCSSLGIDASEVAAFGDHLNDLDLLQWAGHSVAMGNALPEVKDAADAVTGTNDDDGLAVAIEALLARG